MISEKKASGDVDLTVRATDALGGVGELVIKLTFENGIVIDGWTLIMKIRGSDNSDGVTNECDKYKFDNGKSFYLPPFSRALSLSRTHIHTRAHTRTHARTHTRRFS